MKIINSFQCVVCEEGGSNLVQVGEKGKASLVEFSRLQKNESVLEKVQKSNSVFIHEKCRKHFNNRKRIAAESKSRINDEKMPKMQTRNSTEPFSWETNCFFCGVVIKDSDGAWHEVLSNKTKNTANEMQRKVRQKTRRQSCPQCQSKVRRYS